HLQALLYTVALHRYLRTRLAGYDYDRHIAGYLYLFVRGVRPSARPRPGRPRAARDRRSGARSPPRARCRSPPARAAARRGRR
ncbi:hypothetical protein QZM76_17570, partial [Burkholderia multivorans]|nr:hypothetical protein [Burkholderia multivorans]